MELIIGLLVEGAENESLQDAASVAGIDECACCGADAPRGHNEDGTCVVPTVKLSGDIRRCVPNFAKHANSGGRAIVV